MSKKPVAFVVLLDQPEDVTIADMKAYIRDAVGTWCGQFEPPGGSDVDSPGDPRWRMGDTVKVFRPQRRKRGSHNNFTGLYPLVLSSWGRLLKRWGVR